MTNQEKALLKSVIEIIKDSQFVDWHSGNLDQWSNHAKNMRNGGSNAIKILKTLVDTAEEPNILEDINKSQNGFLTLE